MNILVDELNINLMRPFFALGLGTEMPDDITKFDLATIICVLLKKLDWIDQEEGLSESLAASTDEVQVEVNIGGPQKQEDVHIMNDVVDEVSDETLKRATLDQSKAAQSIQEESDTDLIAEKFNLGVKQSRKRKLILKNEPQDSSEEANQSTANEIFPNTLNPVKEEVLDLGIGYLEESELGRVLKDHARQYSIERPFNCSYCNQKFITATSLNVHETIHQEHGLTLDLKTQRRKSPCQKRKNFPKIATDDALKNVADKVSEETLNMAILDQTKAAPSKQEESNTGLISEKFNKGVKLSKKRKLTLKTEYQDFCDEESDLKTQKRKSPRQERKNFPKKATDALKNWLYAHSTVRKEIFSRKEIRLSCRLEVKQVTLALTFTSRCKTVLRIFLKKLL